MRSVSWFPPAPLPTLKNKGIMGDILHRFKYNFFFFPFSFPNIFLFISLKSRGWGVGPLALLLAQYTYNALLPALDNMEYWGVYASWLPRRL